MVVTLVAVFIGYHVNWMSQRKLSRAWLSMQMNGGSFGYTPKPKSAFPWMLKLLGEKPEPLILMRWEPADNYKDLFPVPDEYLELVKRIEGLFPEAVIWDLTWKRSDDEDADSPESESQP